MILRDWEFEWNPRRWFWFTYRSPSGALVRKWRGPFRMTTVRHEPLETHE